MGYARPLDIEENAPLQRIERPHAEAEKLLGLELLRFGSALAVLFFHYTHFMQVEGTSAFERTAWPFYAVLWPLYDYGQYGVQIFWGSAATFSFGNMVPLSHRAQLLLVTSFGCDFRGFTPSISSR